MNSDDQGVNQVPCLQGQSEVQVVFRTLGRVRNATFFLRGSSHRVPIRLTLMTEYLQGQSEVQVVFRTPGTEFGNAKKKRELENRNGATVRVASLVLATRLALRNTVGPWTAVVRPKFASIVAPAPLVSFTEFLPSFLSLLGLPFAFLLFLLGFYRG